MAHQLNPDNDVINLPRSEYKDWTGAEEALSKLARISGAQRPEKSEAPADPDGGAVSSAAQPKSRNDPPAPAKRRRFSRVVARYLIAVGIGVGGTLAWQSHGDRAKQMAGSVIVAFWQSHGEPAWQSVASRLPRLVWPARQPRPADAPPAAAVPTADPVATERAAAPAAASVDTRTIDALVNDLAALRGTVDQMAANQEQMARDIARFQAEQIMRPKIATAERWRAAAARTQHRRSRATSEP